MLNIGPFSVLVLYDFYYIFFVLDINRCLVYHSDSYSIIEIQLMKYNFKISPIIIITFLLLIQSGCQEQTEETIQIQAEIQANGIKPEISFENTIHDFGEVSSNRKYTSEFKFKNTGSGVLKITEVKKCCGVAVKLDKEVLEPGENGTLMVVYSTGRNSGPISRQLYVYSNDKTKSKLALTIKAQVVIRVDYQPQRIDLLINKENAGCPNITITSLDNKPFSITSFQSTGDTITADVDLSVEATKFVLEPKVDLEKHQKQQGGLVLINLTHPEVDNVTIRFTTKQRFQSKPSGVFLLNPRPDEPNINKVSIVSNYGEEFEIESTSSEKGLAKVINQQTIKDGYRLEVEIMPPPPNEETRMFTDMVNVNLKGGETLKIKCYVRYLNRP